MIDEHMQQLIEMGNKLNGARDKLACVQAPLGLKIKEE